MTEAVRAENGMVAASHALAAQAGADTLAQGGSAVDAAIATNAMLAVAYPHMCGLGGDGFWMIFDPATGRAEGIEAAGPAARAATIARYRALGERAIPQRGPRAALTVPGAVDGWRLAHERHGRLDWARLFDPAIRAARDGVPCARSVAKWIAADALETWPAMARVYMPGGRAPRAGEVVRYPALAATLERIARHGPRHYYDVIGAEIAAEIAPHGAPLAAEDFAAYRARWTVPLSAAYRGHTLLEMPPPTQGVAALAIANMLDGFDLAAMGEGTDAHLHHVVEAVKLAFADRDAFVTDPDFVAVPVAEMIDRAYADRRRTLIDPARARPDAELAPGIAAAGMHERRSPGGDTCYFCAIDRDGLACSVIQSLYFDFGSAEMAEGAGVVLQNRGSFFSLDPAHPNALAPGKRTFHTLIPAMLLKDGRPAMIFGTMGGEGQPQTHAMLMTRVLDFGMDVQEAISAPRFLLGRTWGEASQALMLEGRFGPETVRRLQARGHPVVVAGAWEEAMGHAQAIRILPDGSYDGGADPRGDGAAAGV